MEIVKIINNNIVSALDDENKEIVVMGKGLGFSRRLRKDLSMGSKYHKRLP